MFNKEIAKLQASEDTKPSSLMKPSKANTDSGYHGMSEDEMDLDQLAGETQPTLESQSLKEDSLPSKPPFYTQKVSNRHSEERSTTDGSFQTAKEETAIQETCKTNLQPTTDHVAAEKSEAAGEPEVIERPIPESTPKTLPLEPAGIPDDVMNLDEMDRDSVLDDVPVDESRSPSEGSSPAKPLVRKSSLTFASLPAREPLTTKKSIGSRVSRTSHLEQSKAAIHRGSFLGRFTGGKSTGGLRQPEPAPELEHNEEIERDEIGKPELLREQSDGDTKMAKLHSKSSTQRLHDKINMLGKSQPARPTKSIPATAALPNSVYPELPKHETKSPAPVEGSAAPAKAPPHHMPEDDDDDWIGPPQIQSSDSNRPKLSKSTSVDVMEDIRGKHNISDQEFGFERHVKEQNREPSPLRQSVVVEPQRFGARQSRSASNSVFASPTRAGLRSETKGKQTQESYPQSLQSSHQSTTPNGTPTRRYVDGPLSASKSKLQSIMKTARGLFTSSAGVSAQAKMETLSPHSMRTRGQVRESPNGSLKGGKLKPSESGSDLYHDLRPEVHVQNLADKSSHNSIQDVEPRKTRSSTEKEEKRELVEQERCSTDLKIGHVQKAQIQKATVQKHGSANANSADARVTETEIVTRAAVDQPSKSTRKSPRRLQHQHESKQPMEALEIRANGVTDEAVPAQVMGPPPPHHQSQPSQLQRPKELRRPIKPAKEAASKPKPQPVAIRVGTLSQRIPLTNATLSSSLQESLPAFQAKSSNLGKKPSNGSLHQSASSNSLKSSVTSTTAKPKALLAAERKKEQVCGDQC